MKTEPKSLRGYSGWTIDKAAFNVLTDQFPYRFSDIYAEHITYAFNVRSDDPLPTATRATVVGEIHNDCIQALRVVIDGDVKRPDGSYYHITWSISRDSNARPKDSNTLLKAYYEGGSDPLAITRHAKVDIGIIPTFFPFGQASS